MAETTKDSGRHLKAYWGFAVCCCALAGLSVLFVFTSMYSSRTLAIYVAIPGYAAAISLAVCAVLLALWNTVRERPKPWTRVRKQLLMLTVLALSVFLVTSLFCLAC